MSVTTRVQSHLAAAEPRDRRLRTALGVARRLRAGRLLLTLPDGGVHLIEGDEPGPEAELHLLDARFPARFVAGGRLAWGEGYVDRVWDTPDLRSVLALGSANEVHWQRMLDGRPLVRRVAWLLHQLRFNSRGGSRRNIAAHYDLGNDFYALWLDSGMTYSSALFSGADRTLEAAQDRKMAALLDGLRLAPGQRLLEIGCGWGGLAEYAARRYGVSVVAVTISREQAEAARIRIAQAGLQDRVEIRLQDYRDIQGSFDALASVEMLEAVGRRWWPTWFRTVHDRLVPGGRAAIQVITIADDRFDDYCSTADFIQRHVFPGGMLLSNRTLDREAGRAGLAIERTRDFGASYARTLRLWDERFQAAWPSIKALPRPLERAFDERFRRLWHYYLCYCEAGFQAGLTDVRQLHLVRPA